MRKSKFETAQDLAERHLAIEPSLQRVFLIEPLNEDDPADPIKLLEVVEGTIERGIEPIAFMADPSRGIYYPSVIVEVSPVEYDAIQKGKLTFGEFSSREVRRLLKKRSSTASPKIRQDLNSKATENENLVSKRNAWKLGSELACR